MRGEVQGDNNGEVEPNVVATWLPLIGAALGIDDFNCG
jgi:hypothetical protein